MTFLTRILTLTFDSMWLFSWLFDFWLRVTQLFWDACFSNLDRVTEKNFSCLYISGPKYERNYKITMNYIGLCFKYSESSNNFVHLKILSHWWSSKCDFFRKWLDFMTFIFFRDFFEGDFLKGPVTRDSDFWLWCDFFAWLWLLTSDSQF